MWILIFSLRPPRPHRRKTWGAVLNAPTCSGQSLGRALSAPTLTMPRLTRFFVIALILTSAGTLPSPATALHA